MIGSCTITNCHTWTKIANTLIISPTGAIRRAEMSEKTKAIVRLVVVIALFINGFLAAIGKSPVSNDQIYAYVSEFITLLGTAWTWWKNNNVTEAAIEAQGLLKALKDPAIMEELSNGLEDGEEVE